jgi:hypothetical protein
MFTEIAIYFLEITTLIFCLLGAVTAIRYQKGMFDVQGAKAGIRKSLIYFILASASAGLMVFVSDTEEWISSLCIFVGGTIFFLIFYVVRLGQLSILEKPFFQKYRRSLNTKSLNDNEKDK